MTTASAGLTVTIGQDDKSVLFSDAIALYESRAVTLALDSGNTWPSGNYTLALTYQGRAQATASCSWSGGALTATLALDSTTLVDLFDILASPKHVTLDVTLRDEQGLTTWGRGRVDVLNTEWTTATASPEAPAPSDFYAGATAITDGADSVTVDLSAYVLTGTPNVVCTVKGGANLFATVTAKSATAFTATLSAAAPGSGYSLEWVVFP